MHDTAAVSARPTRRSSRTVEADISAGPAAGKCVEEHAVESGGAAAGPSQQRASGPAVQQTKTGTAAQALASCVSAAAGSQQAPTSAQLDCSAASGGQRARTNTHTSKCKPITASDSQASKAASSGRSRKAAQIGIKRTREASDATRVEHLQGCSPPDAAPRLAVPLNPAHSNSTGAVTLPTPHHRSRSSRLLAVAAAAAAAGGTEARPAQTVMEVRL